MLKTVLAALTALSISGGSLAYAQATPPVDAPRSRPSTQDVEALTDARIAALRAGLKLSPEQEKHWPAVEAAVRALAKQRADRMMARANVRGDNGQKSRPSAVERMRRNADAMTAMGTALKQLADASEPLYNSLDDAQKRRFSMLLRMGRTGPGHAPPPWRQRG
jgi:hypothetical protein